MIGPPGVGNCVFAPCTHKGNPVVKIIRPKSFGFLLPAVMLLFFPSCSTTVVQPPPASYYPQAPSAPLTRAPHPGNARVSEQCLTTLGAPRTVTHEVGPMETIWRIARMYGVSEESIYAANGLKPGAPIHIGQKLVVPKAKMLRHVIGLYPNKRWKYIIVHHTATDIGNAKLINHTHEDRGFWHGLGYHFLIDNGTLGKGDGQIEEAPRWVRQQVGAHCKAGGMNEKAIGIALVGNFDVELPTENQLQSLVYLLETLCRYYHIPTRNILGHRNVEGAATDCPGKRFPWTRVRQCLSSLP